MKKQVLIWAVFMMLLILLNGCKVKNLYRDKTVPIKEFPPTSTPIEESTNPDNVSSFAEVDYSQFFDGITGCAVFLNSSNGEQRIYNQLLSQRPASPVSTFKIVSALIGLREGIVTSASSTMGYDGTVYPLEAWNADVTLQEAFSSSCIWYFKKMINQAGQSKVQQALSNLSYGNGDVTQWDGSGLNPLPQLNGFWLDSSLKISPQQQVQVLRQIFEGRTSFSPEHITILQQMMQLDVNEHRTVYGKTGTGEQEAWFVGYADYEDTSYYFAVYLEDANKQVAGKKAQEIAMSILENCYTH